MFNNDCFYLVSPQGLICWNYAAHKQYELSEAHATRLIELTYSQTRLDPNNAIDQDFVRLEVLAPNSTELEDEWGWDPLSRIFHIGTRDIPLVDCPMNLRSWAERYLQHCDEVWETTPPDENNTRYDHAGTALPKPPRARGIEAVLEMRKTSRNFYDEPVSLAEVSQLLYYSLGFIGAKHSIENNGLPDSFRYRRASPSGGGLNATEGYLYAGNVSGLARGIYYYDPHQHSLHLHATDLPSLGSLLSGQHFIDTIPMGVFLTSRLDKLWWKYPHSRAYRMALVEVGHVAQTFQIAATNYGLETWLTGAITESALEPLLGLPNKAEQVMFFVGAGHSDGLAMPQVLNELLNTAK